MRITLGYCWGGAQRFHFIDVRGEKCDSFYFILGQIMH